MSDPPASDPFPPKLALATKNPGKVREVLRICQDWPTEWITFGQASWEDVEETGQTYLDNAVIKARAVADVLPADAPVGFRGDNGGQVGVQGGGDFPQVGAGQVVAAGPSQVEFQQTLQPAQRLRIGVLGVGQQQWAVGRAQP